ncbi:hypothetical protein [Persicobacter diffluens]|uniref:Uncharacterized protein n=1 Tax=Persicobacter diffluens TaxID=981 RepID=A0AAN4VWF8_9BACT|nr:hypothetical protein PEDI_15200 [Persicobacter diffluens]
MSLNLSLLQSIIKIYGEVSSANLKKITDLASLVQLEKGTLICKEAVMTVAFKDKVDIVIN